VAIIVLILLLTLTPASESAGARARFLCLLCESEPLRDAARNIVLFLPLGVVLGARRRSLFAAAAFGALVSLAVELAQFRIPGRVPALQDVATNTFGTMLGVGLSAALRPALDRALAWSENEWRRVTGPSSGFAALLAAVWLAIVTVVFVLSARLLAPAAPAGRYVVARGTVDHTASPLRIGTNGSTAGAFAGAIDEVRVYNRALSIDEIRRDLSTPIRRQDSRDVSLVLALGFDETSGDIVRDASANANDGTRYGAARTDGKFARALAFEGVADDVVVHEARGLQLDTAFTLEAWVRPRPTAVPWPAVIEKAGDEYFLYAGVEGSPLVASGGGTFGGANEGADAPRPLAVGKWTHLATTYDGSVISLYVDGEPATRLSRWFAGRVTSLSLADSALASGRVRSDRIRAALERSATLRVRGIAGPPTEAAGPFVDIRTTDGTRVLTLLADHRDVIVEMSSWASIHGLRPPRLRVAGALDSIRPGDPFDIALSGGSGGDRRRLCVNGLVYAVPSATLGLGWTPLVHTQAFPGWLMRLSAFLWIGMLIYPVGFWSRRTVGIAALAAAALTLTLVWGIPLLTGLAASGSLEFGAALCGFVGGILSPPLLVPVDLPRPTDSAVYVSAGP
jgi:hypothetical protein